MVLHADIGGILRCRNWKISEILAEFVFPKSGRQCSLFLNQILDTLDVFGVRRELSSSVVIEDIYAGGSNRWLGRTSNCDRGVPRRECIPAIQDASDRSTAGDRADRVR